MNRATLKVAVAKLIGRYHALPWGAEGKSRVVVLCYHSVHPTKGFASATPSEFEKHLQWLQANCQIVRFSDVLGIVREHGRTNGRPCVAITFDDGYADNYDYAFPLLRKYGLTATFFVTAGLLENDAAVVNRLQFLRDSSYQDVKPLSWDQLKQMRRHAMDVGSHTYSHPNLANLDAETATTELRRSKEIIETRLQEPISTFAYPFGMRRRHFNTETMRIATEVGYQYGAAVAFRSVHFLDEAMALPRFFVTRDDVEILGGKVKGAWDFLGWWHERAPLWLIKLVSPQRSTS